MGRGVERPFSPLPSKTLCEQRVRRTKAAVALSEVVSVCDRDIVAGRVANLVRTDVAIWLLASSRTAKVRLARSARFSHRQDPSSPSSASVFYDCAGVYTHIFYVMAHLDARLFVRAPLGKFGER